MKNKNVKYVHNRILEISEDAKQITQMLINKHLKIHCVQTILILDQLMLVQK